MKAALERPHASHGTHRPTYFFPADLADGFDRRCTESTESGKKSSEEKSSRTSVHVELGVSGYENIAPTFRSVVPLKTLLYQVSDNRNQHMVVTRETDCDVEHRYVTYECPKYTKCECFDDARCC